MNAIKVKALVDHLTVGDRDNLRTLARGEVFDCPRDRAKVLHAQGKVEYADDPAPKSEAERERAAAHQQPRGDRAEAAVRRGPGATPPEQQVKKG